MVTVPDTINVEPEAIEELLKALDDGELTHEQLQLLAEIEAAQLGLTFNEAVELARKNKLPKNPTGFDLQFHIIMLLS